jgi:hypothetical protein
MLAISREAVHGDWATQGMKTTTPPVWLFRIIMLVFVMMGSESVCHSPKVIDS